MVVYFVHNLFCSIDVQLNSCKHCAACFYTKTLVKKVCAFSWVITVQVGPSLSENGKSEFKDFSKSCGNYVSILTILFCMLNSKLSSFKLGVVCSDKAGPTCKQRIQCPSQESHSQSPGLLYTRHSGNYGPRMRLSGFPSGSLMTRCSRTHTNRSGIQSDSLNRDHGENMSVMCCAAKLRSSNCTGFCAP